MNDMKQKNLDRAIVILLVILTIVVANNQININNISKLTPTGFAVATNIETAEIKTAEAGVVPTGIPEIYGNELQISYDDVSPYDQRKADQTISLLSNFDRTITLAGNDLERYVKIASQISCEYCCGADSIIYTNKDVEKLNQQIEAAIANGKITEQESKNYRREAGGAACGCAHSYAMRGLAKYLLTKHPNEFTDDEILEEMGKWKTLFFPGQIQAKAQILSQQGVKLNYINLASNKYRGIEKGASGSGMVGGC